MIMNKTLITFFTLLFCLTSSVVWSLEYKDLVVRDGVYYKKFTDIPFTGKVTGQEQGSIKNGKKDGSWIEYWDNGKLRTKGNYKNGYREGLWVEYSHKGKLTSKGNYMDTMRVGFWEIYWENGQLMEKGDRQNGKKEGSWISYNMDGTIVEGWTGTFKNGIKISD